MINSENLKNIINNYLQNTTLQLITLDIDNDNNINVEIDSLQPIDINTCTQLTQFIQQYLDQQTENYSLEVGSVSLTQPFKSKLQYLKNIGNNVIVTTPQQKFYGVLTDANNDYFEIETNTLQKVEGKKRKQKIIQQHKFNYNDNVITQYDLKV